MISTGLKILYSFLYRKYITHTHFFLKMTPCQKLTPITLVTWETEIRRIEVRVYKIPSQPIKLGLSLSSQLQQNGK
jgi:hypothetical protein